jgi:hypothetical protein
MSRNGSGTYTLPAGNPVVTGTTISSTWANSTLTNIASALTDSLAADGQTTATGNLKMGNNRITGLADGIAATDAASVTQVTSAVAITGGTINGTTIGATTPTTAAFTTANVTKLTDSQGGVLAPISSVMRNRIINGGMGIAQRDTSFTSGANNNDAYVLDRFYILSDGNDAIDVTQTTTVPTGAKFSIGLDVETTNKKFGIAQIIENANCFDAIGGQVTLSFQAKVSSTAKLDNVKCAIVAWSGTADTVTSDIISAWGAEGTNPTLIANATYENSPANLNVTTSFATYSVTANVDTASTSNIIVFIWSDVTDTTAGDFLYITNVQLEKGTQATSFEYRQFGTELALCQRYFCKTFTITTAPVANTQNSGALMGKGNCASDIEPFCTWQTPVEMRTTPTVTLYAISNSVSANNQWTNGAATATANARAGGIGVGTRQIQVDNTGNLSGSAGTQFYIQAAATAEL